MGLFGTGAVREDAGADSVGQGADLRHKAEKRKRKLERQEKRVQRLSSPLSTRLASILAVLAPVLTAASALAEYASCRTAQAYGESVDYFSRMTFTAFVMWTMFGGAWLFASLAVLHRTKTGDASEEESGKERAYRRGAAISLSVWIVLLALFAAARLL
ncbi:MAG: hypothetical protein VB112_06980 [Oscillospiraceae bacterium]|nr:hypothetical protein [Oscillospiraceae bacterium]